MDSPVEADVVVGVPESGNAAALGFAMESGIPYGTAFVKNGYVGSISVCSNVIPKQTKGVYEMIKEGNITKAELLFKEILPLILALELEPNPIPIKYASKLTCGCKPNPRLPLTTATKKTKQTINDLWRNYEITVN